MTKMAKRALIDQRGQKAQNDNKKKRNETQSGRKLVHYHHHHLDPLALQLVNSGESRCWRLKVDKAVALRYVIIIIATLCESS